MDPQAKKTTTDPVAVEEEPKLPPELQIDILLRLPVKSLSRFRCVCTAWNAAITSRRFISLHEETRSLRDGGDTSLLLLHYSRTPRKDLHTVYRDDESPLFTEIQHIDFPLRRNDTYFFIASCNGLLCFTDYVKSSLGIVLWNPSIRKSVEIPIPRCINTDFSHVDFLGFGFDCKTNDYKVVRLIYALTWWNSGRQVPAEVEIFELSRFKWRSSTSVVPDVEVAPERSQAYVNGGVHWIGCIDYYRGPAGSLLIVVVFDVHNEHFTELEIPSDMVNVSLPDLSIAVCGECLCLLQMNPWAGGMERGRKQRGVCCVWVMKEYGVKESWTRLFKVDMRGLGDLGRVLGFRKDGHEILVVNSSGELVSYDPENRGIPSLGLSVVIQVMNYMESLVLLDCQ